MNVLAKIVSWMFHPLLMPTLCVFLLFQSNTYIKYAFTYENQKIIYGILFINTALIPILLTFLLYRKGLIKSLYLTNRNERWAPLAMTILFYLLTYYLFKKISLPRIIYSFILASSMSLLLVLIINFKAKISTHCLGIGGTIGAMIGMSLKFGIDLNLFIISLIFIAGIIGYARLQLKAHIPFEIYTGYFIGILLVWSFIHFGIG